MALTVMVVDDDPVTLALIKTTLERLETRVLTFEDSRKAAQQIGVERFDLFIVDARMPDMDGFELTRRIRSSSHNSKVPVVMLTAADDGETMREGFKSGISFFLGKPVKFGKLRGLLDAVRGSVLKERRRHARIPFRTEMNCRFGALRFQAESVNLGGNGMAFTPSGGLEEGQILEVWFELPGESLTLSFHAKVLRKEPPDGVAVEFVNLSPYERTVLKNYFAGLVQRAA
jgi:DNA-binding response OmpR family regulator